jgi:hypothetical protein
LLIIILFIFKPFCISSLAKIVQFEFKAVATIILSQNDSEYFSRKSNASIIISFEKSCIVQILYIYCIFSFTILFLNFF